MKLDLLATIKRGMAATVDHLAAIGERMPGLSQLTISAGGVTATVTPKLPAPVASKPATCSQCGRAT